MQNAQNIISTLLPFLVLILIFYFFIIRPQRVQQKKHREMLDALTKGDKIVTTGGFVCEVVRADEGIFVVKLNDDTTAKVAREYVAYKMDNTAPNK